MSEKEILSIISSFKDTRVMVIGDIMLDRYLRGRAERTSPEADVPILDHEQTTTKLGGAANVALNFRSLECDVKLISITGQDQAADEIENLLDREQISHELLRCGDRPTTIKTRIIADEQHLLRVDFEDTKDVDDETQALLVNKIKSGIDAFDPHLIVFQDYNKGLLTPKVIERVIELGKKLGAFICVDPKEKNFWEYTGVDLFKPNLREIEFALGRELKEKDNWLKGALEVKSRLNAENIALTLGDKGILLANRSDDCYKKSHPIEVVDVCGAGDAVLTIVSLLLWKGQDLGLVGNLGNLVGGKVCGYSGVKIIDLHMFS